MSRMPNQCVHCKHIIPAGSREIIEGCSQCGGHFFFYIRDEQAQKILEQKDVLLPELDSETKVQVEEDVRSILDIDDDEAPVVLDLESVRITGPGKYELDLVSLINRKPIIFKVEEGKYLVDIEALSKS